MNINQWRKDHIVVIAGQIDKLVSALSELFYKWIYFLLKYPAF